MEQGVVYDEKRLMDLVEEGELVKAKKIPLDISPETQAVNVFEYLKFAARRETAPIKAPFIPYTTTSNLISKTIVMKMRKIWPQYKKITRNLAFYTARQLLQADYII